jgi:N-acetylneuraminic acid mutarotase
MRSLIDPISRRQALVSICGVAMPEVGQANQEGKELSVKDLPPLPEAVAGQFVGVHAGRLIVAGGTMWSRPKWEGGEKRWTAAIHTLGPGDWEWRRSGEQSEVLAYGGAVTTPEGLICIGGQSPSGASTAVTQVSWDGQRTRSLSLADLPEPRMALAGAGCGHSIFAMGGQSSPTAGSASQKVWLLEAVRGNWQKARWKEAPHIPGPGRILPAAAGGRNAFYLASGAALSETASGAVFRTYLRDAFVYRPGSGWEALPDLPAPVVAAPAICDKSGRLVIFGGDDGTLAGKTPELGARHPGFSRTILRQRDSAWFGSGMLPESLVTSGAALWNGAVVIPGGENIPGTRTARVLSIQGWE